MNRRTFGIAALLCGTALPVLAQAAPAGNLFLEITSSREIRGKLERAYPGDRLVVAGVSVELKSGVTAGPSDDSGYVSIPDLPEGKVELTMRSKLFKTLRCKIDVRANATDTVSVVLIPEQSVEVWDKSPGCKKR